MKKGISMVWISLLFAWFVCDTRGLADSERILLASTTSTENSGLLSDLLPRFQKATGIGVDVVVVGTGQAMQIAKRGDVDLILVHDRLAEDAFMREGFGSLRRDVMYNDFVIVGPIGDPAKIAGLDDAAKALGRIATSMSRFTSRGDTSGTHRAELRLWRAAGVDPAESSGQWYWETGSGMGATLNTASATGAYLLIDRATWSFSDNKEGLAVLVQGDSSLFNPYGVILVNPERHSHVKEAAARRFIDWLTGIPGQKAIDAYRPNQEQLFFPSSGVFKLESKTGFGNAKDAVKGEEEIDS